MNVVGTLIHPPPLAAPPLDGDGPFSFDVALRELRRGNAVARFAERPGFAWLRLAGDDIEAANFDFESRAITYAPWTPTSRDLLADDWCLAYAGDFSVNAGSE